MLEAESRFRTLEGYRGLAQLAVHVEADLIKRRKPTPHRIDTTHGYVTK